MYRIPEGLPNDEKMKTLRKIAEETKAHMRRFVAMRGN